MKGTPAAEIFQYLFLLVFSSRIIKDAIISLDSEERVKVLIIDDSMFERNRSKKVELLAKVYGYAKHCYIMDTIPPLLKSKLQAV